MKGMTFKNILSALLLMFIVIWPTYLFFSHKYEEIKPKEDATPWTGVISIWDYPRLNVHTGSRYGWIEEKIKKFEKKNPGVYIDFQPLDWNKGPIKLEVGLTTGTLPDIGPIGTDFAFMREDILEPLDEYFTEDEKEKFKYQALRAVTYDNKMWGMPFMMTTYAMYINLDIFRQRGVEPPIDGNWTYEEFVEKMQKLTWDSKNDGKIDQYGFMSFVKPDYYNIWGFLLSDGAQIIDEDAGEYRFYGEKAITGLNKIVDLNQKHKVTPDDFGTVNENQAWEMFYKEKKVAVYPTGSWAVRVLNDLRSKGEGFDFAIANYPIGDKRIPTNLSNNVSGYGVFKQEDKEKLNMCIKFLKFLIEEDSQRGLEKLGVFPVITGIDDLYENDEKMKKIEDCLLYTQVLPKHKNWKDIDRILQNQIRLAIIGEKSSEEALEEAKDQVEQLLRGK